MPFERMIESAGEPGEAMDLARTVLVEKGYRLSNSGSDQIEGVRGGMLSKGQDPLLGASQIAIRAQGSHIRITAELGGVKKTLIFMVLFIAGMAAFFLVLFGSLPGPFSDEMGEWGTLMVLAPLLPWPFLMPFLAWFMKRRTESALDTFTENLATVSGGTVAGLERQQAGLPALPLYVIGIVLIVGGSVLGLRSFIGLFSGMTENEILVTVPGSHSVLFEEATTYTAFHLHRTSYNDRFYDVGHDLEGLQIILTSTETGLEIPVERIGSHSNYSNSGRAAYSAFRLTVDQPGSYDLAASYPEGQEKAESVLSIVPWSGAAMTPKLMRGMFWIAAPIIGAMLIVLATQRRKQARRHSNVR